MKSFPRWLIVATGLVMLTLIGGGYWFYIDQEQTFRENSEANLQAVAELKVNQIAEWRSEKLRDAEAFTASPLLTDAVERWLANPQPELAEKILSQFSSTQELFHYRDVMLVDRVGQVRLSLRKHHGSLHEEAARSLVEALRDGRPVMTDLHAGPADLPPHIDVVAPLFSQTDKTKNPNGAVILQIDARRFLYPLIQFWLTPSVSAETLLVRRDGDSVLFLNDLRHQPDTALKLRIPLSRKDVPAVMAVLGKEGVVQGTDYRGVTVLSVLKAIPNSPWFMVAKVDKTEALAGWQFRAILILVFVIALLASLVTAVGVVWQKRGKDHYKELFLAETALLKVEEGHRITLMSVGDGIISTDVDGRVEVLNPVAEALTGWSHEEASGKPVEEVFRIVNEETRQTVENPVSKILSEGLVVGLANHTVLVAQDGTERPIADSAAPIRDEHGEIIGVVLVFRDQSEQRAAQRLLTQERESLRESERFLNSLLNTIPAPIFYKDKECLYLGVNKSFEKFYGTVNQELVGKSVFETAPLELAEKYHAKDLELFRNPGIQVYDSQFKDAQGAVHDVVFHKATFTDVQGHIIGLIGVILDVTDRKRVEEFALQSARLRAVADLSCGVAHHFNNLLQIVIGNTSLSLEDLDSGNLSEVKTNLEQMLQAANLGAEIVKRLQIFANMRADITERESVVFDMATTARNAAEVSQPFWKSDSEKKGINIELQLDLQDGCLVKGQENEMFEVMVNLIRNAAEALPLGGDIEVKAYREADEVVITVRDTGIGIAEHVLPKVFQPFCSSKGVGIGKGMGLAVTHGLVKRHGGTISAESKVGVGTTFTIRLPLAQESVTKTEQSSTSTSGDHLTILVIDDDVNIASLLERICAKAGHSVFRALSGQEGLAIFNKEAVDLVISDLGMPGMNGWDVGKAICSTCQERGISKPPFILLTGYGGQELEKEKIIESGVDAVVAKPIDRATVLATVQETAARFRIVDSVT